jgi:hypothetical protein
MESQKTNGVRCCSATINHKKIIALISLVLMIGLLNPINAQKMWEARKGAFRSQGNLGGGYLIKQKNMSAYVNGEMELFLEDRYAFTGAVCFSVVTLKKNQTGIKSNHAVFAGADYHFLKPGRFDPFIGLTPGAGLVQAVYRNGDELKTTPFTLVPLLSLQIGCNYYVGSFLNFFVKVQGVTGQIFSNMPTPQRLDEIKFMGGLGFNLRLWKPKKLDTWI